MSHWKKFETKVLENVNQDLLTRACRELGIEMDTTIKSIRNSYGQEACDAGLIKDGKQIALGFNFTTVEGKTKLELSGDFWGTGIDEESFIDKLAVAYQKTRTLEALDQQGYIIDINEVNEEGILVIEGRQWA